LHLLLWRCRQSGCSRQRSIGSCLLAGELLRDINLLNGHLQRTLGLLE
jgi:hypothetical protein